MIVKDLKSEDFVNYKKPSMFIAMGSCDYKCCIEAGIDKSVCQNDALHRAPDIRIDARVLVDEYLRNPITEAVVLGGLDPLREFCDVQEFVSAFREKCDDDIVIYTGYYAHEVTKEINWLRQFPNIIVKYGRYIPNRPSVFDHVLGVELASDNQHAVLLEMKNEGYCKP